MSTNVLNLMRLGALVAGCTLALGGVPACVAAGEDQVRGDAARGVSAPMAEQPSGEGTHHAQNALDATPIRVGVSLGALIFAVLWFVAFWRSPIRVFPGLIVALYVGLAFGFGGDAYPVSRFDMYAQVTPPGHKDPARLVVQDASGELHTVQSYSRWSCDARIEPLLAGCFEQFGPFYYLPYIDREDITHIDRAGPPTHEVQEVALVRAVWRLSGTRRGIQRVDICPLVTCRAAVGP